MKNSKTKEKLVDFSDNDIANKKNTKMILYVSMIAVLLTSLIFITIVINNNKKDSQIVIIENDIENLSELNYKNRLIEILRLEKNINNMTDAQRNNISNIIELTKEKEESIEALRKDFAWREYLYDKNECLTLEDLKISLDSITSSVDFINAGNRWFIKDSNFIEAFLLFIDLPFAKIINYDESILKSYNEALVKNYENAINAKFNANNYNYTITAFETGYVLISITNNYDYVEPQNDVYISLINIDNEVYNKFVDNENLSIYEKKIYDKTVFYELEKIFDYNNINMISKIYTRPSSSRLFDNVTDINKIKSFCDCFSNKDFTFTKMDYESNRQEIDAGVYEYNLFYFLIEYKNIQNVKIAVYNDKLLIYDDTYVLISNESIDDLFVNAYKITSDIEG